MSDDVIYYDDGQFERLVRFYDKRKDRGVDGLISRILYFREAYEHLEPERFDRFCERIYIRGKIERDLLHHFGKRLETLDSKLGSQLGSFCVLQILLLGRGDFERVVGLADHCRDPDARSLFRDLVEALISRVNKLKPGDPDVDIWGMNWKTDLMINDSVLEAHETDA
jgi:hypothetical protein